MENVKYKTWPQIIINFHQNPIKKGKAYTVAHILKMQVTRSKVYHILQRFNVSESDLLKISASGPRKPPEKEELKIVNVMKNKNESFYCNCPMDSASISAYIF